MVIYHILQVHEQKYVKIFQVRLGVAEFFYSVVVTM
jgi:hypothetical protein